MDFAAAVETKSAEALEAVLHPDVEFRSPAVFRPYQGRDATMTVLRAVMSTFEDFRYVARYRSDDGAEVLQFTARVGEYTLEGVDLVRTDADGLVTHLTVLIRPLRALGELVSRMGQLLG